MIDALAFALSVLALVLFAVLALDLVRRPVRAFGGDPESGRGPGPGWRKAAWAAVLALSFAGGFYGLPVTRRTDVREGEVSTAAPIGRESRSVLRLPFLVRETRIATAADGTFLRSVRSARTQVPWSFALVALLYGWRVVARDGGAGGVDPEAEGGASSPVSPRGGGRAGRR